MEKQGDEKESSRETERHTCGLIEKFINSNASDIVGRFLL